MPRIVVDPDLLNKLFNLAQPLEFCTASGAVLGTFIPFPEREAALRAEPFISDEELGRRAQGDGCTTNELIAHLESL